MGKFDYDIYNHSCRSNLKLFDQMSQIEIQQKLLFKDDFSVCRNCFNYESRLPCQKVQRSKDLRTLLYDYMRIMRLSWEIKDPTDDEFEKISPICTEISKLYYECQVPHTCEEYARTVKDLRIQF